MTDYLLERITRSQGMSTLVPPPWPEGLAPVPAVNFNPRAGSGLPECDVMVVTWTTAEAEALADTFTPGHHRTTWQPYTKNWSFFEGHLSGSSPARQERCAAHYWPTQVGKLRVLCVKSELHLATDDATAPIVELWKQMIQDANPKLVITTGTAGGIGESTVLGDVFICTSAKFNCTKTFKDKPWAQERFTSGKPPAIHPATSGMLATNAGRLQPIATRPPLIMQGGDVETVDYFAFDDTDDSYGVVSNDPHAHTEEMDDSTLPLALAQAGLSVPWVSVRNASDPEVPSSEGDLEQQKKWASKIYDKYGYWTTVCSALTCWGIIAELQGASQ